jgi:D-alanyl-D-alanine carboxypeptidase (penicillin-binding protein 5/6)
VLSDHPLKPGQSGPQITVTPADVAQYQADVATHQSVAPVTAGEQLTELQALEALLIPSANNVAHLLATWDRGSLGAFVAAMNAKATALGLTHSHFVGPSGLSSGSVSTAEDLVRLGEAAMANPVFASVVAMPSVTLPGSGVLYNYNYELGHDGFIGIKTGSDGPAGGCFLFDDAVKQGASTVQIIGAVLGSQTPPIIQSALNDAVNLVNALRPHLGTQQLVAAGQQVAEVTTPWGAAAPVDTATSVSAEAWPGLHVPGTVSIGRLTSTLRRGQRVGTLTVTVDGTPHQVPLVMGAAVAGPTTSWKLTRL